MTVYYAFFDGKRYYPLPYSLRGSMIAIEYVIDKVKFLYRCRLTENGCQKLCDKLNKKNK